MITEKDLLFLFVVILLLLLSMLLLVKIKNKEKQMNVVKKAKRDMIDLEAITKNIETNYKPVNIELTSYEQEQENNAIISYQELLSNREANQIKYDDSYEEDAEISVKKVNLGESDGTVVPQTKIEVSLMSYEKEEAFLKALRQLQKDLLQ